MAMLDAFVPPRSRETQIRRDRDGRWFNGEDRLTHPKLVLAFDRWLKRADGGRFCLQNDINWAYVRIEGPAHFVRRVKHTPDGARLFLSNGQEQALRPHTLWQSSDGALFCTLTDGSAARFDAHAVMQLSDFVGEDEKGVFLRFGAREKFHPPIRPEPESGI